MRGLTLASFFLFFVSFVFAHKCTFTDGSEGQCLYTSACEVTGGKSDKMYCPGPRNYQCCKGSSIVPGGSQEQKPLGTYPDDKKPAAEPKPATEPKPAVKPKAAGDDAKAGAAGDCKTGRLSQAALDFIKKEEGWFDSEYADPVGLPTIGYGHLCEESGCAEVKRKYGLPLVESTTGLKLLADDVNDKSVACFKKGVLKDSVKLNENQWGMLVSWAFNVGCGAVATSTLIERLNQGGDVTKVASEELPQWRMADGAPILAARRGREVEFFKKPSSNPGWPLNC